MAQMQLHRCRFMDYSRPFVTALAFSLPSPGPKTPPSPDLRLAVGRANGDIEIWNPTSNWALDTTLLGAKDRSIEDLAWASTDGDMRLFSVGASDAVTEWNLATGEALEHTRADAGVIWAIALSPDGTKLAVACETGTVVIFDVSGGRGSVEFSKRLTGADTSLASLAWKGNNHIVAGGADARLRVWEIASGRIVGTMKVDKSKTMDGTVVWAVKVLRNGDQIVSGDSNGYLKIWDGKTLSLQQSFQAHPTDILSIATDASGETLFSSGLDQKIVCAKMTDVRHKRWTIMTSRVAHSHDIRCMTTYEARGVSYLISGGLESTIVINSVSQFEDRPFRKLPLTRYRAQVEMHSDIGVIVEWREQKIRVWQLHKESKRLLAELVVSGDDEYVSSASLNGETLAVATLSSIKLFKLNGLADGRVTGITKQDVEGYGNGARIVKFLTDNKLLIVSPESELDIYRVDTAALVEVQEPLNQRGTPNPAVPYSNEVSLVAVSANGAQFAVAKYNGLIEVYNATKATHVASLPKVGDTPTAMAFRPKSTLVVVTADMGIYEYDIKTQSLTPWSRQHAGRLPPQFSRQHNVCCGIFTDKSDANRVWFWGPNWLAYLDFAPGRPYCKPSKRKNQTSAAAAAALAAAEEGDDDNDAEVTAPELEKPIFWMSQKYRPIFFAGRLGSDILVSEKPAMQEGDARPFWSNRHIKI